MYLSNGLEGVVKMQAMHVIFLFADMMEHWLNQAYLNFQTAIRN